MDFLAYQDDRTNVFTFRGEFDIRELFNLDLPRHERAMLDQAKGAAEILVALSVIYRRAQRQGVEIGPRRGPTIDAESRWVAPAPQLEA